MIMVDYPGSFPLDEIKSVIENVRNGTVRENIEAFAHDVWVLQGFAQKSIIGEEPNFSLAAQSAPEGFEPVKELEQLVAQAESDGETVAAQASVPWQLILQWAINYLLEIIEGRLD